MNIKAFAISISLSLFATLLSAPALANDNDDKATKKSIRPQLGGVKHEAFGPGEDLTYSVKYGFVKGGEGHFFVRDTIIDGRKVNHIVVEGRTTGVADVFYKVRDSYQSYMDCQTQLPLMSKRIIREGRYRYTDQVTYNRLDTTISKSVQRRDKPVVKATEKMPLNVVDVIGAFYHARNNAFDDNLQVGDTVCYDTFFANELFPLRILYRGTERVNTVLGPMECYVFSPITEVGRSFKTQDDMKLWISKDANRLPVKVKFDLAVGSFVCELSKASGLKHKI